MDSNNIYSQCITSGNGPCGTGKHGEKGICKINMLNRSVEKHYQNLKINIQQRRFIYLTEKYLLENRLFIEINESSIICPCHCDNQEIYGEHPADLRQLWKKKHASLSYKHYPSFY